MKGTEKQIAWAKKIKVEYADAIRAAKELINIAITKSTDGSPNNLIFKDTLAKLEAIESTNDATWWINNGKMEHESIMTHSPLYRLANARVIADTKKRLIATINAVK